MADTTQDDQVKAAQMAELKRAAEAQGATVTTAEERHGNTTVNLTLTPEALRMIVDNSVEGAKKAIDEVSKDVQRKYDVPAPEARKKAEEAVQNFRTETDKRRYEDKLIAECFSTNYRFKKGMCGHDVVARAYDKHDSYVGRDTRAMSVTTDTTGGYLSPELFSRRVFENLERYGLARKYATMINMETEILRIPKVTADVTAAVIGEATQISASDITAAQLTLQPLKLAVMAGPFSDELLINADPSIVQILQESAARGLAKLEDNNVFIGTSSSFTGLLESTTNNVDLGGADDSGSTSYADITFDDAVRLVDELEERYISEGAAFWWSKKVTAALRMLQGADQYLWTPPALSSPGTILGYPYHHVVDMTATTSANTHFAAFGDLRHVWVGTRGPLRFDLLTEGTVNSVNLGETASYALRVIEYWDNEIVDTEAFSILETSSS
jgi:HK97 family phage major capsid protein